MNTYKIIRMQKIFFLNRQNNQYLLVDFLNEVNIDGLLHIDQCNYLICPQLNMDDFFLKIRSLEVLLFAYF